MNEVELNKANVAKEFSSVWGGGGEGFTSGTRTSTRVPAQNGVVFTP